MAAPRVLLLSVVSVFILITSVSNVPIGLGQQSVLPNLAITDVSLTVGGIVTFSLPIQSEGTFTDINITANVANNGTASASGFAVEIRIRREDQSDFGANECSFFATSPTCNSLSLGVGQTGIAIGSFRIDDSFEAGRYIIQTRVLAAGLSQSSTDDDVLESILLVGIDSPEYHPVFLSFSPPSPVIQGSSVTIRAEIENTGRPESPELSVAFSYCLPSPTCEDADFATAGFADNGIRTLSSVETSPLSQGERLVVTNSLDTTSLSSGRYIFKVSVSAPGVLELDPNNNEIQTTLTIGSGSVGGLCQLPGEITTIGEGTGTLSLTNDAGEVEGTVPVGILYIISRQTNGQIELHAINQSEIDNLNSVADACPEILGSPIPLQSDVTTFTIDDFNKILYVGLASGQLYVVDVNNADNLSFSNDLIAGGELLSLSSRVSGAGSGQVFIGTATQQLFRLSVSRNSSGNLDILQTSNCMTLGSPVRNLAIFQGRTYFTSGSQVFRIDETRCDSRTRATVFTALGTINAMDIGNIRLSSSQSPRIVVGTSVGNVHVFEVSGFEHTFSPFDMGSEVTALALNTGEKANSEQRETVFAATVDGKINAIRIRSVSACASGGFQSATQQPITVLSAYEPSAASSSNGWVFAGTADSQLLVVNDECGAVIPAQSTQGEITSNILITENRGVRGPDAVTATYGGGPGLFSIEIDFDGTIVQ
jgi:hypothetical protein